LPAPPPNPLPEPKTIASRPNENATDVADRRPAQDPPVARDTPEAGCGWVSDSQPATAPRPTPEHPLVAALRCQLEKRPEDADNILASYDPSNRELISRLLALVARFANPALCKSKSRDAGDLIEELNRILASLRSCGPLKIEKICFCNRIKTYGVYEPLSERVQFRPDDQVQIYVELRNFSTLELKMPNGDTRHLIRLRSSYEIQDETRKTLHQDVFLRDREAADESRTPRQDYFENYVLTVPPLKPGHYILWITIEDLGTEPPRSVKGSLDFHVPNSPVQMSRGSN
jgi:hypothetical protein